MSFNPATQTTVTICATARLSHGLLARQEAALAQQNSVWQTPIVCTLQQWLNNFCEQAFLCNEPVSVDLPGIVLSNMAEKMLWQQAITQSLQKNELAALFDIASLADSAIEANQLLIHWQVRKDALNAHYHSQETWHFLRWRAQFQALCQKNNALEAPSLLASQINIIQHTQLNLPAKMQWIGFDRLTPLMQNLIDILQTKGVKIDILQANQLETSQQISVQQDTFADIHTECRAAVAWAQEKLACNANAQLAIITPVLGNIRRQLADLLDDTFHPQSLNPSQFEMPRVYDFSIGLALSEQLLIACALKLLRIACAKPVLPQTDFSAVLLDVGWSQPAEIDSRCQFDAQMRKNCPRNVSLNKLIYLAEKYTSKSHLLLHLQLLQSTQQHWKDGKTSANKQLASVWANQFVSLLDKLNWAKTRPLSSVEFQANVAWQETLQSLSNCDALLGKITVNEALYQLTQLCASHMFLPQTKNMPNIQILGMLESSAITLDGAWVLGLNDHHWPPPARANALLPISIQRDLKMPNASADIQAEFALLIQQRLINCANEVVFSWALKDTDRELRPSPVLKDLPFVIKNRQPVPTMAEKLASPHTLDFIDDNIAPAIIEADKISGGSQLFAAQATCPAWAFYQYRLGATALETPTDGLDSMARGNLVHAALQYFWLQCKNLTALKSLSTEALNNNINAACAAALKQCDAQQLPIRIIEIEQLRLQHLLQNWLALELQRDDFTVQYCEREVILPIDGLLLKLRIDRIDALIDGGLVVIDYKTGAATQSHTNWAENRIKIPQLPLYAALVLKDSHVVATCFAKVHVDECKLTGIAEHEILDISAFAQLRADSAFKKFADVPSLIAHWQASLGAIANEIKTGVADVRFEKETDLLYCDVKPLLRLPERELQFEQQQNNK